MKPNFMQQEILLITKTSFTQNQAFKFENNQPQSPDAAQDITEDVYINGLIKDLLPEIFKREQKMYLWQMHFGISFVQLELGELPLAVEKEQSVDPHKFLNAKNYN